MPRRRVGHLLFLSLGVAIGAGCEESTLPVIPDEPPHYTGVSTNVELSTPVAGTVVQPGEEVDFSFTVYYQIADDWAGTDLDMWFLVRSWSDDVFVQFEYLDLLPIESRSGTMRFQGTIVVPDCGSIDQIDLVGRVYERDGDLESYVDQDGYVIDVQNASSTACPV